LKDLKVDIAVLSNNHIRDYDDAGVLETIETCSKSKIKTVGAGRNFHEAAAPLIIESGGHKIAILNFSESEFNTAGDDYAGSNPDEPIHIWKSIQQVKKDAEILLAVMHGGKELYPYPTPYQMKLYRFIAELGAHAVIGHHSHVIGGYEVYQGVPIIYSLGNFIFDEPGNVPEWYLGAIAKITIDIESHILSSDFRYVELSENELKLVSENELSSTSGSYRAMKVIDESEVYINWQRIIKEQSHRTIKSILNLSVVERILLKFKIKKLNPDEKYLISIGNRFRCETHRRFTIDTIQNYKNKRD
jgi:poly-gamma-glutamate synthesis protein (capsule biosynthesis protein)